MRRLAAAAFGDSYGIAALAIGEDGPALTSGTRIISLIPRPFELRRRKGLVHMVCTCTGGPQKKIGGFGYHHVFVNLKSI